MAPLPDPAAPPSIVALAGVYDADGTALGELTYFIGARLGRAHCSLCEITHGLVRAKPAWNDCRAALPVPFETFHRDEMPEPVSAAVAGRLPAVVAELDDGTQRLLLGPDELDACAGSLDVMVAKLGAAARERGLDLELAASGAGSRPA